MPIAVGGVWWSSCCDLSDVMGFFVIQELEGVDYLKKNTLSLLSPYFVFLTAQNLFLLVLNY